jgi:hemerythrin-like domain-containing protein
MGHFIREPAMTLKSTLEKAGKKIQAAVTPAPVGDILETLRQEHDLVQGLLKRMVDSDSAGERHELLAQIKAALVPHTKAEEKAVYDRVLKLKGHKVKIDGHEGYFEHEAADRMLANLGKIERVTSDEFTAAAKVLKELIDHHIEEEERNIWADVKENFSARQRVEMNEEFEAVKKRVRIPH